MHHNSIEFIGLLGGGGGGVGWGGVVCLCFSGLDGALLMGELEANLNALVLSIVG